MDILETSVNPNDVGFQSNAAHNRTLAAELRERLAQGRSIRFLVPDAVLAYIQAHGLYPASP